MKTMENIRRIARRMVLMIAAISFTVINGSTQVGNSKPMTLLIDEILPLSLLDYVKVSRLHTAGIELAYEVEPAFESWMTGSNDWNSAGINMDYVLMEETEESLEIEDWMVEDFTARAFKNMNSESTDDEKVTVEKWMLNHECWGK
ncbi:MAG: hypothetical protein JXR41_01840 [Bacteroidales bacterium]|nr:hypothetical protein [Bacteroidales bacterium]